MHLHNKYNAMKRVKITEDNFVWHVLTEAEAKRALGQVEVYALYDDDSEALVQSEQEIEAVIHRGAYVGIEVGFIDDSQN